MEIMIYFAFSLMLIVHVFGCVAFMWYLKKMHREQVDYLYKALVKINKTIPTPKAVMSKTEKVTFEQPSIYKPSEDVGKIMRGDIIQDPFD